ncbi:MAG: hypothetical protein R2685_16165 [Candidatus Nitrosocosmicus sp.]|nr:hypothetical protein [Candidatus Nitrosocosmicus sp.]
MIIKNEKSLDIANNEINLLTSVQTTQIWLTNMNFGTNGFKLKYLYLIIGCIVLYSYLLFFHIDSTFAQTVSIMLSDNAEGEDTENNSYLTSLNSKTNKIYITNGNNLSIIDGVTNKVTSSILLRDVPTGIAVNPETNKVYFADSYNLIVVNGTDGHRLINKTLEKPIKDIAINSQTDKIYTMGSDFLSVIDGFNYRKLVDINVNDSGSLAVNPETNKIYITNGNNLSIIDGVTNKVTSSILLGDVPTGIAVNPETNKVFIITSSSRMWILDGETNNYTVAYNSQYLGATGIAVNPETNKVYVVNPSQETLSITNGFTNKIETTITTDLKSTGIAVNPETNKVYVVNSDSGSVSVIDGKIPHNISSLDKFRKKGIGIETEKEPTNIAVNPETNKVYVVNSDSGSVSVIDGKNDKVITNVKVGENPTGIAVNPETNKIYIANSKSDTVSVIDGSSNKVDANISGFDFPQGIALDVESNMIYVANGGEDFSDVSVIEGLTNNITQNYPTHGESENILIDPENHRIYLTYFFYYFVSVLDSNTGQEIFKFPIEGPLEDIAVNPATSVIYASYLDSLLVIDAENGNILNKIVLGKDLGNLAFNPVNNKIYVIDSFSNYLSVIDAETLNVETKINIGEQSRGLDFDSSTNTIYVSNTIYNNVLLIDGKTNSLVLPVTLNSNPSIGGSIKCNGDKIITNQQIRLKYDSLCVAENNKGYQFVSWVQNLGENATKSIVSSPISNSPFDFILNILDNNSTDEGSKFAVNASGIYTANFQALSPPISQDSMIALYTLTAGIFSTWFIPNFARWLNSIKQRRNMMKYFDKLTKLENHIAIDENPEQLRKKIIESFAKGRISESQYKILIEKNSDLSNNNNKLV